MRAAQTGVYFCSPNVSEGEVKLSNLTRGGDADFRAEAIDWAKRTAGRDRRAEVLAKAYQQIVVDNPVFFRQLPHQGKFGFVRRFGFDDSQAV